MAEPTNGVQRELGIIIGKLDGIGRRLDSAEASRKEMYRRFDLHNAEVSELRRMIDGLAHRIAAVEIKADALLAVAGRFEKYEGQGKTAWSILSFLSRRARAILAALGVIAVAFWREILALIRGG